MKDEIIIYQSENLSARLEVRIKHDTIWLSQAQIVSLFNSSKANISEHIKHILQSGELEEASTIRKIRTVQKEGYRSVAREITHYNLDMIISIGYRVNSLIGTKFRIWANSILKEYLIKGYAINQRMDKVECDIHSLKATVQEFDLQIRTNLPHNEGIFFDGQVFDAYTFVVGLIKLAKQSVILIDNYIDESVLTMLSKKDKGVKAIIYTPNITKQMKLDIAKYNKQYPPVEVKLFTKSHDRFLIIDKETVYHIGASLKDLGKKWFAFSKISLDPDDIISKLN